MLLKVGLGMMLLSLVLAAGVAVAVGLRGGTPTTILSSAEPKAAETPTEKKRGFDPGKKLEIDDEASKESQPKASQEKPKPRAEPFSRSVANWPRPTNDELASA